METTPFIFGRVAVGHFFTDRDEETRHLIENFRTGTHTVLISPRRWGKSSLVGKATRSIVMHDKKVRVCTIDLYNCRNENQFYQLLASGVLRTVSGKIEEALGSARDFLSRLVPQLTFKPGNQEEFDLSLSWKELERSPLEILDLAENLARKKKLKLIICIDEFQNIQSFSNPLAVQKQLRAQWQKHQHVTYCLYGSKRSMMMEVFSSSTMPFYKFGDLMFLQKIKQEDWVPFLLRRFSATGKKLNPVEANLIPKLVECHPYYVQQLAQQVWLRTQKNCNEEIIHAAYESLLLQMSLLFQNLTDTLPSTQVNFLHALINGEEQLSSKEVLEKYELGTSANVLRIKDALVIKEVVDIVDVKIEFLDPLYKGWLKKYYFRETK